MAGRTLFPGDGTNYRFAVARYNPNGSLDTSFSEDGKLVTAIGTHAVPSSVAIQPDGKILVAGSSREGGISADFTVVRYNANGSLDSSFDGDGTLTMRIGAGHSGVSGMALQSDGKIVVAGTGGEPEGIRLFALVRLETNGSLDATSTCARVKSLVRNRIGDNDPLRAGARKRLVTARAAGKGKG